MTNEVSTIKIKPTSPNKSELEFKGTEMAFVTAERQNSVRWTEMTAYKTESGKWVVVTRGCTKHPDEQDRLDYLIFRNAQTMARRLNWNGLVNEMFQKAGIEKIRLN